ncbi:BTAD domain-containing putative transcriptional regulator [Streptomyces zagrosensis]|uniref:DNA-binding SARP family transcriptional activator n=1 Tax=Streptomyces zagrosensis TaxID=1042984 RepID=A0A7W9Q5H3_9ACTN|nr:BTAD domain-containing putative transcriptional regulator [Streptomyces zagrosensis]MBB5934009.1 DNA-binding SARP family transcriptional activator [Streptomyces zagrosensis]
MEFSLLGPVAVRTAHGELPLGPVKRRSVLAMLLLQVNSTVPVERLITALWEDAPPEHARTVVQGHVSRLRATLTDGGAQAYGIELTTQGSAYLLRLPEDRVDAHRFEELVGRAREMTGWRDAAGRPGPGTGPAAGTTGANAAAGAVPMLREALGLWRGPALTGTVTSPPFAAAAHALEERRLSAVEALAYAHEELGQYDVAAAVLHTEAVAHPLREGLIATLMRALYRAGRQSDAIHWYHRTRGLLSDELGVDPGEGLRRAYEEILHADTTTVPTQRAQRPAPRPSTSGTPRGSAAASDDTLGGGGSGLPGGANAARAGAGPAGGAGSYGGASSSGGAGSYGAEAASYGTHGAEAASYGVPAGPYGTEPAPYRVPGADQHPGSGASGAVSGAEGGAGTGPYPPGDGGPGSAAAYAPGDGHRGPAAPYPPGATGGPGTYTAAAAPSAPAAPSAAEAGAGVASGAGGGSGAGSAGAYGTPGAASDAGGDRSGAGAPWLLPRPPTRFRGRDAELAALTALVRATAPGESPIALVTGPAGVGKTAYVVHWAHQHAAAYPDGLLFADLRGFGERDEALPVEVLRDFLLALGTPPDRIPRSPESAAALYRSRVARRRLLVVLDNARSSAQVRPLLPGGTSWGPQPGPGAGDDPQAGAACVTLVTSRSRLDGLVATDAARPVPLQALTPEKGVALLTAMLGTDRVTDDLDAAQELVALCDGLPLALRAASAQLTARPRWRLARLTAALRDEQRRLALLSAEDTGIAAALRMSVARLSADDARLLSALGTGFDRQVEATAVAAFAGSDPGLTQDGLDRLAEMHLVDEEATGRYTLTGLVKLFARNGETSGGQVRRPGVPPVVPPPAGPPLVPPPAGPPPAAPPPEAGD